MALIKTDSQNYTDIANAIREVVGVKTFFDEYITTVYSSYSDLSGRVTDFEFSDIINNYSQRVGETFEIVFDDMSYFCELKIDYGACYYLGNHTIISGDSIYSNTGEPFFITSYSSDDEDINNKLILYTKNAKTYHVAIVKKHYKPSEMKPALDEYISDYGVSYDTFDENGNVLTATTYGYKVAGLCGNQYLETVNIDSNATEIGDYAFNGCGTYGIFNNKFEYKGIHSLELPNGITRIGNFAFASCYGLFNLTLPDTITEIGSGAFFFCWNLIINKLPSNLKKIGSNAFGIVSRQRIENNEYVPNELIIPESVEEIEYCAFFSAPYTTYTFKGKPNSIGAGFLLYNVFDDTVEVINVPWSEGAVMGAPWGATNAIINYNYTESTEV